MHEKTNIAVSLISELWA